MPPGSPLLQGRKTGEYYELCSRNKHTKVVPCRIWGKSCHRCRWPRGLYFPQERNGTWGLVSSTKVLQRKKNWNKSCYASNLSRIMAQVPMPPSPQEGGNRRIHNHIICISDAITSGMYAFKELFHIVLENVYAEMLITQRDLRGTRVRNLLNIHRNRRFIQTAHSLASFQRETTRICK